MNKGGRPRNELRDAYREKYKLTPKQAAKLYAPVLEQLERCKDEDARRVLLGIGAPRRAA